MWGIEIDRESELPLWRQIYKQLINRILRGEIRSNEVMPSTRELAKKLNVSRNTVCQAYDMLITEGYIKSQQGALTRVSEGLQIEVTAEVREYRSSAPARVYAADFRTGRPDLRLFPRYLWQQLLNKAAGTMPLERLGYTGPQGDPALLREISAWLYRSRGINVDPDDIFITSGATHALHMIAELLSVRGQQIIMEDPCHMGMHQTFIQKGISVIPVPVDQQGLQVEYLSNNTDACAIYVTPSHQFPLGGILPAGRRTKLMKFAWEKDMYIIEDDYDSEFRYGGEPVSPLFSMDPQRVIYVGTFSKTLFPSLRIGYVILPRKFHSQWRKIRTHTDVQNPSLEQAALAELMASRKFDKHVKSMRRVYSLRRELMRNALLEKFKDNLTIIGDEAGLHMTIQFASTLPLTSSSDSFRRISMEKGVKIIPVEYHCIKKGIHTNKLLLGYGHLNEQEILKGIDTFESILTDYLLLTNSIL